MLSQVNILRCLLLSWQPSKPIATFKILNIYFVLFISLSLYLSHTHIFEHKISLSVTVWSCRWNFPTISCSIISLIVFPSITTVVLLYKQRPRPDWFICRLKNGSSQIWRLYSTHRWLVIDTSSVNIFILLLYFV